MKQVNAEVIIEAVRKHGFIIVPMIDVTNQSPPIMHTVGLTEKYGVPELVIAGIPPDFAVDVMEIAIDAVVERGSAFASREALPLPEGMPKDASPMRLIDALPSEIEAYGFVAAKLYYGERMSEIKFQQVLVPDNNDKMPWDEGFDEQGKPTQIMFWTEGAVKDLFPKPINDTHGFFTADETTH